NHLDARRALIIPRYVILCRRCNSGGIGHRSTHGLRGGLVREGERNLLTARHRSEVARNSRSLKRTPVIRATHEREPCGNRIRDSHVLCAVRAIVSYLKREA